MSPEGTKRSGAAASAACPRTAATDNPRWGEQPAAERRGVDAGAPDRGGALEQRDVEDSLYGAAELNGRVDDDGDRQCWATIRSELSAGLLEPIDLTSPAR